MSVELMPSVLFVCMGNICRSPLAEGTFQHLLETRAPGLKVAFDSAGTHAYHVGELPDTRSIQIGKKKGIDITHQRARQLMEQDFYQHTYILAMDKRNVRDILAAKPQDATAEVVLYLERFAPQLEEIEVPDPYYGEHDGFAHVYHLVETAAEGLLHHLQAKSVCV